MDTFNSVQLVPNVVLANFVLKMSTRGLSFLKRLLSHSAFPTRHPLVCMIYIAFCFVCCHIICQHSLFYFDKMGYSGAIMQAARVDTKINGHEDKRFSEICIFSLNKQK